MPTVPSTRARLIVALHQPGAALTGRPFERLASRGDRLLIASGAPLLDRLDAFFFLYRLRVAIDIPFWRRRESDFAGERIDADLDYLTDSDFAVTLGELARQLALTIEMARE